MSRTAGFVPLKLTLPVTVAPFAVSAVNPGLVAGSDLFAAGSPERPQPVISNVESKVRAMSVLCKFDPPEMEAAS